MGDEELASSVAPDSVGAGLAVSAVAVAMLLDEVVTAVSMDGDAKQAL